MMDATTEVCREIIAGAIDRMQQERADPVDAAHALLMAGFVLVRRDCHERELLEALAAAIDRRLGQLRAEERERRRQALH